jgi:hypothetical protein
VEGDREAKNFEQVNLVAGLADAIVLVARA